MSPRRSSRARATANQPTLAHHSSSSSSGSSTRGSSTRHHRHHDDSIDHEPSVRELSIFTDLRNGNNSASIDLNELEAAEDDMDENGSQGEEITRCICGHQEYQGEDDQTDTSEGLFILCDKCHVWQHGFCVGITDKTMTPDNYFCEKCRPELHKLVIRPHGPKSSIYLPVHAEASPTESHGPKDMPTKRRSTMNSRDAAYDNAFELQRAIEESKSEQLKATRGSTRGRKRGTSEGSDEQKDYKRAKTIDSDSHTTATLDSADDKEEKGIKKGRNATGRTTSASSTKRPIRNKANDKSKESKKEDSEIPDDSSTRTNGRPNKTSITTSTPIEETNPTPASASETQTPDTPQQNSKRNNRATNGAGGGRRRTNNRNNSHRQSEDPLDEHLTSTHPLVRNSSQSGCEKNQNNDSNSPHMVNGTEKPAKSRLAQKTSLTEMNKRVNTIMEFIQRTQLEMALEKQRLYHVRNNSSPKPGRVASKGVAYALSTNEAVSSIPQIIVNGTSNKPEGTPKMHSTEIMDILTRKLVHWQQTYGKITKV